MFNPLLRPLVVMQITNSHVGNPLVFLLVYLGEEEEGDN